MLKNYSYKMNIIITLEGNIGSGKSTMLNKIKEQYPQWNIVQEPVDIWEQFKTKEGKNLLECFYTDTKRWSYTLQNCAFITRYTTMNEAIKAAPVKDKNIFIIERSVLTDRYVFAEMLFDSNMLDPLEWKLYTTWFDYFIKSNAINGIVHITTEPDTCKQRIIKRGRHGEENISIDYLRSLDTQHNKWLSNTELPVIKISSEVNEIHKIEDFINTFN